jgi:hypothetical protein
MTTTTAITFALAVLAILATWAGFATMRDEPAPPPGQKPTWLTDYYRQHGRARAPRFSLRVDGELFESDAFGGIIEQMRARGYSTDDLVAAALVVHHTPTGAEIKPLVDRAQARVAAAIQCQRCGGCGRVDWGGFDSPAQPGRSSSPCPDCIAGQAETLAARAALHDLRCQDTGCVSQGEGEAIMCERCPRVGCSDCIAFDEGLKMYICDLCPEDA